MRTNEELQRLADAIREEDSKPESIARPTLMDMHKRIANLETALKSIAEKVCREDAEWIDTVLDGSAFEE